MKRVPVYLSVEEMKILREGLDVRGASSKEDGKIVNRLDEVLEEEIERNTEPTGNSDE